MNKRRTVLTLFLIIFLTCVVHAQNEVPQSVHERITGKDGAPMALIPASEFQMGSLDGKDAEKPVHTVYVDAFYIDVYEVTSAQYKKFMGATKHPAPDDWKDPNFNSPDQPVVGTTWFDATAYAQWAGKRLPTEAEWEKAARGGLVGKRFPWGDEAPDGTQCNFADKNTDYGWSNKNVNDDYQSTAPVGSFPPNGYNLYGMAGNVWEWCADWWGLSYYAISPEKNPKGPDSGVARVMRGGSWVSNADSVRAAFRNYLSPALTGSLVGFRCAADVE
jgi:formylglycine-generating enzyme required for sulfatase activity